MDPEKNGSAGEVETERSGAGAGNEPDQSTPLRHQEPNYPQGANFMARSTRIRMAAAQVQGGPAGVYALMCGTLCCNLIIAVVVLVLLNIVSITSIIIGAVHLNDCPAQPNIPIMLIALGTVAFVIGVLDTMDRAKERRAMQGGGVVIEDAEDIKKPSCFVCINSVLKTMQLVLFVYTCVIVYRIYSTVIYTKNENLAADQVDHYCHSVVYLFAFWFLTVTLIVLGAVLVFLLCICFCAGALLVAASD